MVMTLGLSWAAGPAAAGVTLPFARRLRMLVTALIGVVALIALRSPKPAPQP